MSQIKKSDLKRFQKTQDGLIQFAMLLEQASPRQRVKILEATTKIDPYFVELVLRKTVYFEELIYLDESILSEILSETSPKILACALTGMGDAFSKKILRHLSYQGMKATLDEGKYLNSKMSDRFIIGARNHILKTARELEAKKRFVFELMECPRFENKPYGTIKAKII